MLHTASLGNVLEKSERGYYRQLTLKLKPYILLELVTLTEIIIIKKSYFISAKTFLLNLMY